MSLFRSIVVRSFCFLLPPVAVIAGQTQRMPVMDLSLQVWEGFAVNRAFSHDGGVALDGTILVPVRAFSHGAVIGGAGVATQQIFEFGDTCVISPGGLGPTRCAPDFPSLSSLTAL